MPFRMTPKLFFVRKVVSELFNVREKLQKWFQKSGYIPWLHPEVSPRSGLISD